MRGLRPRRARRGPSGRRRGHGVGGTSPYGRFLEIARSAGPARARGFGISGSGPSVFALCKTEQQATQIADAIEQLLISAQIGRDVFVSRISTQGAHIL